MTEPMPPIEQRTRDNIATERVYLPRITIKYCTQCKWMLRAAYVFPAVLHPIDCLYIYEKKY